MRGRGELAQDSDTAPCGLRRIPPDLEPHFCTVAGPPAFDSPSGGGGRSLGASGRLASRSLSARLGVCPAPGQSSGAPRRQQSHLLTPSSFPGPWGRSRVFTCLVPHALLSAPPSPQPPAHRTPPPARPGLTAHSFWTPSTPRAPERWPTPCSPRPSARASGPRARSGTKRPHGEALGREPSRPLTCNRGAGVYGPPPSRTSSPCAPHRARPTARVSAAQRSGDSGQHGAGARRGLPLPEQGPWGVRRQPPGQCVALPTCEQTARGPGGPPPEQGRGSAAAEAPAKASPRGTEIL